MPAETIHHAWREGKMVASEFIRFVSLHPEISVRAQKTKHNPFLRTAAAGQVTHWTVMLERQLPDSGGLAGMAIPFSKCGPDDPPVVAEVLHTLVHECRAALQAKTHEEFGQVVGLSAMSSFHRRDLLHLWTVARQQAGRLKEILGDELFQALMEGPKDKRKKPAPEVEKPAVPSFVDMAKDLAKAMGVPEELLTSSPPKEKQEKFVEAFAKAETAAVNQQAVESAASPEAVAVIEQLVVAPAPAPPPPPPPAPAPPPVSDDTLSIF